MTRATRFDLIYVLHHHAHLWRGILFQRVRKKARAEAGKLAKSLGGNVDEIDFAAVTGLEEVLASSAFMFSNLWLNDALRRSLNPTSISADGPGQANPSAARPHPQSPGSPREQRLYLGNDR